MASRPRNNSKLSSLLWSMCYCLIFINVVRAASWLDNRPYPFAMMSLLPFLSLGLQKQLWNKPFFSWACFRHFYPLYEVCELPPSIAVKKLHQWSLHRSSNEIQEYNDKREAKKNLLQTSIFRVMKIWLHEYRTASNDACSSWQIRAPSFRSFPFLHKPDDISVLTSQFEQWTPW